MSPAGQWVSDLLTLIDYVIDASSSDISIHYIDLVISEYSALRTSWMNQDYIFTLKFGISNET